MLKNYDIIHLRHSELFFFILIKALMNLRHLFSYYNECIFCSLREKNRSLIGNKRKYLKYVDSL